MRSPRGEVALLQASPLGPLSAVLPYFFFFKLVSGVQHIWLDFYVVYEAVALDPGGSRSIMRRMIAGRWVRQARRPRRGKGPVGRVEEQWAGQCGGCPDGWLIFSQVGWFPSNYVEEDYSEYC